MLKEVVRSPNCSAWLDAVLVPLDRINFSVTDTPPLQKILAPLCLIHKLRFEPRLDPALGFYPVFSRFRDEPAAAESSGGAVAGQNPVGNLPHVDRLV